MKGFIERPIFWIKIMLLLKKEGRLESKVYEKDGETKYITEVMQNELLFFRLIAKKVESNSKKQMKKISVSF